MGVCQNYGPLLDPLNTRCRTILRTQKGAIILTTTHILLIPLSAHPDPSFLANSSSSSSHGPLRSSSSREAKTKPRRAAPFPGLRLRILVEATGIKIYIYNMYIYIYRYMYTERKGFLSVSTSFQLPSRNHIIFHITVLCSSKFLNPETTLATVYP